MKSFNILGKEVNISILVHIILCIIFVIELAGCESIVGLEPHEHIEKAKAYVAEGDVYSSIIELKIALQKDAKLAEARWLLGQSYLKLGDGLSASKEFEQARNLGYDSVDLVKATLEALLYSAKFQEVLDKSSEIISEGMNTAYLHSLRGHAYLRMSRLEDAITAYNNAINLDDSSVEARLGIVQLRLARNDTDVAKKYLEETIEINPTEVRLWLLKGNIDIIERDFVQAEKNFKRAVSIASYNVLAQLGLARSFMLQNKLEEAEKTINFVLSRYKQEPTARFFRAYIAYRKGETESAKDQLRVILRNIPEHRDSLLLLSNILYQANHLEETAEVLTRFLVETPRHLIATKMLAFIRLRQNTPEKAIEVLEEVIGIHRGDAQIPALMGAAYMETGNTEKGLEFQEEAIRINPDEAGIRAQFAMGLLVSGATDKAISELESAISINPNLFRADILLALTHINNKNFDEAILVAQELANKKPDDPLPLNIIGSAYLGKGNFEEGEAYFIRALQLKATFTPAIANLAQLDIEAGNKDKAEKRYLEILEIDEHNIRALIELAKFESQRKNYDKMVELLVRAKNGNPSALQPKLVLGLYYYQTHNPVRMLEVIEEAILLDPINPVVMLLLAKSYRLNGKIDDALISINKLLSKTPESIDALLEYGRIQLRTRDIKRARDALGKILSIDPNHYDALISMIRLEALDKRFIEAKRIFTQFTELYPDSNIIYILTGDILKAERKMIDAAEAYEKALTIVQNQELIVKLATTYITIGEKKKARLLLNNWGKNHPDDIEVGLLLASSYYAENNIAETIRAYKKVLERIPDNMIALNNLAWLYFKNNDPKALGTAERAYTLTPEQPEVADTLGWVLVNQDQIERGLELLRFADATMNNESPDIRYHIAVALLKTGDERQAKKELELILGENESFVERDNAEELLEMMN